VAASTSCPQKIFNPGFKFILNRKSYHILIYFPTPGCPVHLRTLDVHHRNKR